MQYRVLIRWLGLLSLLLFIGAVTQPVPSSLRAINLYNVKNFGAKGDGTTDDTAAILAAIAAAPTGSIIFFPSGTYLVGLLDISGRTGLTFEGTGWRSILKRKPGIASDTGYVLYFKDSSSDIIVRSLAFDMNNCLSFCGGVKIGEVYRFSILDNRFFDSNINISNGNDKFGILLTGASQDGYGLIQGNLLIDLQMEVDRVNYLTIVDNTIIRPRLTAGIGLFTVGNNGGQHDVMIVNNTIQDALVGAGAIAVSIDPPSDNNITYSNITIAGNHITYKGTTVASDSDPRIGIFVGNPSVLTPTTGNVFVNFKIYGNQIVFRDDWGRYGRGIQLLADEPATSGIAFTNFSIHDNTISLPASFGGVGLEARNLAKSDITKNIVRNQTLSGGAGMNIVAAVDSRIVENSVTGTQSPAYLFDNNNGGTNMTVWGNSSLGIATRYTLTGGRPASFLSDDGIDWHVVKGTCTGDANGGKLTIDSSGRVICATAGLPRAITFELGSLSASAAVLTSDALAVQYLAALPFACTLSAYDLAVDVADSTVRVKFWRVNGGTAIPTSSNSINTSGIGVPTGTAVHSTTLTDFTSTALAVGDRLAAAVSTSAASAKAVMITLTCS